MTWYFVFFFFQAEDGIRDVAVTGVQTCALPISRRGSWAVRLGRWSPSTTGARTAEQWDQGGEERGHSLSACQARALDLEGLGSPLAGRLHPPGARRRETAAVLASDRRTRRGPASRPPTRTPVLCA